jgi:hypothetical protein
MKRVARSNVAELRRELAAHYLGLTVSDRMMVPLACAASTDELCEMSPVELSRLAREIEASRSV